MKRIAALDADADACAVPSGFCGSDGETRRRAKGTGLYLCPHGERLARGRGLAGRVFTITRADEDEDVLFRINAAKSALNGCGKVVLEGHIKHCVRDGIEHGDAEKTIESFTKAVERFANMQ